VQAAGCQDKQLKEGSYMVTEVVPAGSTVADITCFPAISYSNISIALGMLQAALAVATTTIITFTNIPSDNELALHGVLNPNAWFARGRTLDWVRSERGQDPGRVRWCRCQCRAVRSPKPRNITPTTSPSSACPDCGSQLEFAEGCVKCHVCGFSECG
jgi:hypothetical protein